MSFNTGKQVCRLGSKPVHAQGSGLFFFQSKAPIPAESMHTVFSLTQ